MTKQTWGLDWCLAFSCISCASTQTQGVLLAACVYQIHRQKYDRGDTCFEHVKSFGLDTTSSCWTQRRFYRLRLLSRQRTSCMVRESHMLEGCTVTVSSDGSLHFFSIFHCWCSAIIAIFLFSMTKQTWGLDWCLAFSCISCASTQTQGVLLAACVYQIHRQKYDRGDTCFEHVKSFGLDTTSSCWTQRRFYRLRLLSRQRTSRMVWESHMLEGCTVTVSSDGSLHFFSIFHCWCSAIIAIFLFSMTKQTWGLDWCLAFSRISFSFTQTQDTQGLLLAACVYQIHRQKYDKGDTCIQQDWTCEIIWTWHDFILLNPKEVLPSSSTQQTED